MKCRKCGIELPEESYAIGGIIKAAGACATCAPEVISADRFALKAAIRILTEIKQLAKEPTKADLEAIGIPIEQNVRAGLLGIAGARLKVIGVSVESYLDIYAPMIPGREPSKEVTS